MKKILTAVLSLILLLSCILCAVPAFAEEDDAAYILDKGTLVIGITIFDPINYYEGGKLVGFDTDFAKAVCANLGIEPVFQEINWDTKEIELNAKSIDCIWNGMTITEDRKENMAFSAPYIRNKQVIVIRTDNKDVYTDTASLSSAVLVAEMGSSGEEAILTDENLSKGTYVGCGKQADTLLEVKAGTADAAVIDYVMAKSMVGEGTDYADLTIIEGVELGVEEYGIGFRKGSGFAALVDEQFTALLADGTMAQIAETYGQADVLITEVAK